MRTLILMLLCLCWSAASQAQYVVFNVNETVYADEKPLKKKDKINENAKLRFSSAKAHAYVMSPGKGYYILGVKDKSNSGKGEFILALKDALLPPNEYYAAATRTYEPYESKIFEDQYDLKAFFRDELFFVEPAKFKVLAQRFPLDEQHFFMIKHHVDGGWFGKPLPHVKQEFEINPQIFQLQDKLFGSELIRYSELLYVNQETGEEQYLGKFKLRFFSAIDMEEDLKNLHEATGTMPAGQFLREHAMPFLTLRYGKTQPEAIARIVDNILK